MKSEIFSKRDICLYFIISIIYITIILIRSYGYDTLEDDLTFGSFLDDILILAPGILAMIVNIIMKLLQIQNEKWLKVIKILFNLIMIICFLFSTFVFILLDAFVGGIGIDGQ